MSADVGDLFSGLASAFAYEDSLYSEEIESMGRRWPEDGILMARAPPRETRDIMSNGAKQTWPALAESQITSHTVLTLCSGDAEQESATLTGCNWPGGRPEREAITSAALRGAARVIGSACQRRRCGITAAGKRCPLSPATHLQTTARTALARAMPSRGARQPGAGGSKSRLRW